MIDPHPGLQHIKPHMVSSDVDEQQEIRIDLSSNESVYGPGKPVIAAMTQAATDMERYAHNATRLLSEEIARQHALDPDGVVCGHGSDDLLLRVAQTFLEAGDELVCSVHGYQRIPNYAYANNALPVTASDRDFTVDVDAILGSLTERTRMVMIANPDNPTGTYLSGTEIRRLHSSLPENVLLVLDSAYLEYVSACDFENPAALVEDFENVVMTRTFSKIYGLAGLRLGWLYAPPPIADSIRRIGMTFPLSNIAFQAGMAALANIDHPQFVHEHNLEVRTQFESALIALGLEVIPSQTNFLLVRFPRCEFDAERAYGFLLSRGILARRMAAEAFSDYIRFTIGLMEEMNETIDALNEFFACKYHENDGE